MAERAGVRFNKPQFVSVGGRTEGLVGRAHHPDKFAVLRIQAKQLAVVAMGQPEPVYIESNPRAGSIRAVKSATLCSILKRPEHELPSEAAASGHHPQTLLRGAKVPDLVWITKLLLGSTRDRIIADDQALFRQREPKSVPVPL